MRKFFADTNLFLQCRDLGELPWSDVAEGQDILILVPRTVQREIDRLKSTGNSRRARRARKTTSLLRQIIGTPGSKHVVRQKSPRVVLSFPPRPDPKRDRPADLDLSEPDDRIIDEALAYATTHPDEDVRLLTHDTNPMLTAQHCGLRYIPIPDDWLAPPEPDAQDKAIAELKRRLGALENRHPQIEIEVLDVSDDPISELKINTTVFDALPRDEIDRLVDEIQSRHPMARKFGRRDRSSKALFGELDYDPLANAISWVPPTGEEIERYRQVEYPKWLDEVRRFFEDLPGELSSPTRRAVVSFEVTNGGMRPAENVVLEIEAKGGLLLIPPRVHDEDGHADPPALAVPSPPLPPESKPVTYGTSHLPLVGNSLDDIARRVLAARAPPGDRPKDRYAFYWKDGSEIEFTTEWAFTCEEFRHKADPEYFNAVVYVPQSANLTDGALTCRVTASNLPEPAITTLPVRIFQAECDTVAEAHRLSELLE